MKEKYCFACGSTRYLEKHHIYFGAKNRQKSDDEGCWVWLCHWHHTGSPFAVHEDSGFDKGLKKLCELEWCEVNNKSIDDFRKVFGKNYL